MRLNESQNEKHHYNKQYKDANANLIQASANFRTDVYAATLHVMHKNTADNTP